MIAFLLVQLGCGRPPAERFVYVGSAAGGTINVIQDTSDGRCWGQRIGSNPAMFGPIPCS